MPEVSYDPLKTIEMEGNLFWGLANPKSRSKISRMLIISFVLIFFIAPSTLVLFFGTRSVFEEYTRYNFIDYTLAAAGYIISILYFFAGIKIIYKNLN